MSVIESIFSVPKMSWVSTFYAEGISVSIILSPYLTTRAPVNVVMLTSTSDLDCTKNFCTCTWSDEHVSANNSSDFPGEMIRHPTSFFFLQGDDEAIWELTLQVWRYQRSNISRRRLIVSHRDDILMSLWISSDRNIVTQMEIKRLYSRFRKLDKDGRGRISNDSFMSIPELAMNPLASRIIASFDFNFDDQVRCLWRLSPTKTIQISFKQFIEILSVFSPEAKKEDKIKGDAFFHTFYDIQVIMFSR